MKPTRTVSTLGLAIVVIFWTAVAVLFDAGCVFVYWPRAFFGMIAVGTTLIFAAWRPKLAVSSAIFLGLVLIALYPIRWNHLKSFYIDSYSLHKGMRMDDVRRIMSPYIEVGRETTQFDKQSPGVFGAIMLGAAESQQEHESRILFIPSEKDCADWCVVYPENGIVNSVTIHPD